MRNGRANLRVEQIDVAREAVEQSAPINAHQCWHRVEAAHAWDPSPLGHNLPEGFESKKVIVARITFAINQHIIRAVNRVCNLITIIGTLATIRGTSTLVTCPYCEY